MRPIVTFVLACLAGVAATGLTLAALPAAPPGALETASVHVAAPAPAWNTAPLLLALAAIAGVSGLVLALPSRK